MNKGGAAASEPPSSLEYSEQRPLTPEAVERLARVFLLLASVSLPEEHAREKAKTENPIRSS